MSEINIRPLSEIVDDLWGAAPQPEAPKEKAPETPVYQPSFPPFEQLWKTADDTVDWTDALAHDRPTDNLTSPHLWAFFHQHADRVLHGDLAAYIEVLKAANPLGDMAPYGQSFDVEAASADLLRVRFDVNPVYLGKEEGEVRRYLCGVSLRAARDLMALLPVREVSVEARHQDAALLQVTFQRSELQKVRFSFIDPVAFVTACGASF